MTKRITIALLGFVISTCAAHAATTQKRYYGHDVVEDENGVIAPWYTGRNGQIDMRVRIAAETLKRYPWTPPGKAPRQLPEYMYSGAWKIDKAGNITVPLVREWANGDLGQRAAYVLAAWVDYYRYSGDPAAIAHMTLQADMLLDFTLTPKDHPWPEFLISVPVRGKTYGQADPHGFIQLDIVAEVGIPLIKAAQICGNDRWMKAAQHWGDLLAEHCARRNIPPYQGGTEGGPNAKSSRNQGSPATNPTPLNPPLLRGDLPPWGRYANPEDVPWEDTMTGGVAYILEFFDTLIGTGYTGKDNAIVEARNAGVAYLRDALLPRWTVNDTWGRNYWDWPDPVQAQNVTEFVVRYLMEHPDEFPNWRTDARNILTLFLNHTAVALESRADVYSGAWAFPESNSCCGRSLWYAPLEQAPTYAQYAAMTGDPLMREIGRRMMILATYDVHETGVVEDNLDGGAIVAGSWFKIAHPMAIKDCLNMIAWDPERFAPPGENHIVRSTATVVDVSYSSGQISYGTAAAPSCTVDTLRMSYEPKIVEGDGKALDRRETLNAPGYCVKRLSEGDCIVQVRHDGATWVRIIGRDLQSYQDLTPAGARSGQNRRAHGTGEILISRPLVLDSSQREQTIRFRGDRVQLMGDTKPDGGQADVYLDEVIQSVPIDCWSPTERRSQTLYYRNGLKEGDHTLRIVAKNQRNPQSQSTNIYLRALLASSPTRPNRGPLLNTQEEPQRWIFGYSERSDYLDKAGNPWRPATEWVVRSKDGGDSVAESWWTRRTGHSVEGTDDPELYRYGAHAKEFWADFTVSTASAPSGPPESPLTTASVPLGKGGLSYHARLKFMESRNIEPRSRAMDIFINGREVAHAFDIAATAADGHSEQVKPKSHSTGNWTGRGRAVDLVFNDLLPKNGIISIRFKGTYGGEAIVQAIEVGPGEGGKGDAPTSMPADATAQKPKASPADGNLLTNGGFEEGATGDLGGMGKNGGGNGWTYVFANPGVSYLWGESQYSIHPDWGLPVLHGGKEALRTHADHGGHTMAWQEVEVAPKTQYVASVWVQGVDLHGKGFGKDACDSAGLILLETDEKGKIVKEHAKQAVTQSGNYQQLQKTITTGASTRHIRFIVDTVIHCPYGEGHVTYDDCALKRRSN